MIIALFVLCLTDLKRASTGSLEEFSYKTYLSLEYLPAQKKLSGRWPSNLNGLERYVAAENKRKPGLGPRLDLVMKFHRSEFQSLEPLHQDKKAYTYILHLKEHSMREKADMDTAFLD